MICAVPRARAVNVRGGSVHAVPGGRHTMIIGEIPGARIDGLVDVGADGHGNCAAITLVPTATRKAIPFCAGVTVSVPCPTLGGEDGDAGGTGVEGAGEEDRAADVEPPPEAEGEAEDEPEGPPGTPEAVPVGVPGVEAVPVPAP